MAIKRKLVLISILSFFILTAGSCQNKDSNHEFNQSKDFFYKYYSIDSLFRHFPNKLNNSNVISGCFAPPEIDNSFGEMFLSIKTDNESIKKIVGQKFLAIDSLNAKKFILMKYDFVADSLYNANHPTDTCFKYPIADLYKNDFQLGKLPDSTYYEESKIYIPISKYKIPQDLVIYLTDSQQGDFWKSKCTRYRSKFLGKWRNGYSRGYAISQEKQIIVYWLVTW